LELKTFLGVVIICLQTTVTLKFCCCLW